MQIEVANQQTRLAIDEPLLVEAARGVLAEAGYTSGELSIAVVDDPTIHGLNRQHLAHDYPTDVLSFCLEATNEKLVGEVIVSADTAIANAADYGWPSEAELLLYVLHGTLHLVGYRDKADEETLAMREAEARHLCRLGVALPAGARSPGGAAP